MTIHYHIQCDDAYTHNTKELIIVLIKYTFAYRQAILRYDSSFPFS